MAACRVTVDRSDSGELFDWQLEIGVLRDVESHADAMETGAKHTFMLRRRLSALQAGPSSGPDRCWPGPLPTSLWLAWGV